MPGGEQGNRFRCRPVALGGRGGHWSAAKRLFFFKANPSKRQKKRTFSLQTSEHFKKKSVLGQDVEQKIKFCYTYWLKVLLFVEMFIGLQRERHFFYYFSIGGGGARSSLEQIGRPVCSYWCCVLSSNLGLGFFLGFRVRIQVSALGCICVIVMSSFFGFCGVWGSRSCLL